MKVGQIYLEKPVTNGAVSFLALVEALDRLAIEQHVLVTDVALARSLQALPYVTVGPSVRSPVMACCLMPDVDITHTHSDRSAQAGLLLALTRAVPFIMSPAASRPGSRNPLNRSAQRRARCVLDEEELTPERVIEVYRRTVDGLLELPQDADGGQ